MIVCPKLCGECCGTIPLNKKLYEKHKDKIQRKIINLYDVKELVIPVTNDLKCIFIDKEARCVIYDERPQICRNFGYQENLECPYFKPNGNPRSIAKQKQIHRKMKKFQNEVISNTTITIKTF